MRIPIANLYYMLCYAWDMLEFLDKKDAAAEKVTNPADLLGFILAESTRQLMRRGLARSYVEHQEEMRGVKGKIAFSETLQKVLHRSGRTICITDEYSADILVNQILKSTLNSLAKVKDVSSRVKEDLQQLEDQLYGVSVRTLSSADFQRVHIHRLNRHYSVPLKICDLIWQQLIPSDESGRFAFEEFERDEVKMRHVFERFVRNFYRHEMQGRCEVNSEQYRWFVSAENDLDISFLPIMKTDASIKSDEDFVVVETKFIPDTFLTRRQGKDKIRSNHLYQLMSYLQNISLVRGIVPRGILLYPEVDHALSLKYVIWGFDVRVFTIDLGQEWENIRKDLLALLKK